jgi:hypothetical protein
MADLKHCKVCKTSMLLKFFQSNPRTVYKSCDKCREKARNKVALINVEVGEFKRHKDNFI